LPERRGKESKVLWDNEVDGLTRVRGGDAWVGVRVWVMGLKIGARVGMIGVMVFFFETIP
jgi:hypothetical protein